MLKIKRSRVFETAIPRWTVGLLILLLAVFSGTRMAGAQTVFGTVVGNVIDPSGALVSGANVTLQSGDTGQRHTMKTTSAGTYAFVNLDPGTYSVKVEQTGFKTLEQTGVVVQVGSTTRSDLTLQVGDVSQMIEVTGAQPLIQTDTTTLGGVIEQSTIKNMPLSGRNVNDLLTLVPGVIAGGNTYGNPSTNIIAAGNFQIGGGFGNQSIFFVDGVQQNIPENNSDVMIPSQDVVSEFKVDTNNVSAQYGLYAGGVVNISTKAGSNTFHGSAYEYLRNKVLDANDFFSNRVGHARPPYVQNQYGYTIGGPVKSNRLFFFLGMEWEPVRQGATSITTVPTTAMMGGDFSAPGLPNIYDPTTGLQFQYQGKLNVIPPGDINLQASQLFKTEYPAPTVPNAITNNYVATSKTAYNQRQYNTRLDWTPSSKDLLFARYAYWNVQSLGRNIYGLQATNPGSTGYTDHEAVLGNTYTVNPTTVVDAHLSYLRAFFFTYPTGLGTDLSSISPGLASFVQQEGQKLPMAFNWPGTPIAGMGVGSQLYWYNNIYTLSGSLTKILGRHTLKAGADGRQTAWISAPDSNGGSMTFTSQGTGYAFASGLLGTASSMSTLQVGGARAFMHQYSFYVNDTYQVNQKLTAELGLRWDQPGAWSEVNNYDTVILPNAASPLGSINNPATGTSQALQGALTLVNSPAYSSRREEQLHYDLWGPRVGLAYRVFNDTVIRAGYGVNYIPANMSQDGPNSSSINSSTTNVTNVSAGNPFPTGIIEPPRRDASALNALYGQNIQSRVPNMPYGYVQQWNVTTEKQFGNSTSLSVAYAGAKGTHLQMTGAATWSAQNLNQLPDSYDSLGQDLLTQVPNPFYGNPAITRQGQLSSPTIMKGLLLKPMPQYNYVTASADRVGASSYNALQALLRRNLRGGGIITAAYTWSKLLSNTDSITGFLDVANFGNFYVGGVQDNTNLRAEKSLSLNDTPQDLTISYVLNLPFGKGQRFLSSSRVNGLVSGWRVNGVTSFIEGTPLAIGANANDSTQPNYLMKFFGAGGYLQNQNGTEPLRPNLVPGCNRKEPGSAVDRVNSGEWFNTACFTQPGSFQFGNESRTDGVLRRQGQDNWDASIAKETFIKEKFSVTFDAEFFNLFNRVQFAPPFESRSSGPNWGHIVSQLNNPRLVQFGLRISR